MDNLTKTTEEIKALSNGNADALKMSGEHIMKATDEITSLSQGNVEAMMKSGQIWAAGCQSISRSMATAAQAQRERMMSSWKAMSGMKTLKEVLDLQNGLVRTVFESAVAESSKLTEASVKLAEETMAPLTERMTFLVSKSSRELTEAPSRAFPGITNHRA